MRQLILNDYIIYLNEHLFNIGLQDSLTFYSQVKLGLTSIIGLKPWKMRWSLWNIKMFMILLSYLRACYSWKKSWIDVRKLWKWVKFLAFLLLLSLNMIIQDFWGHDIRWKRGNFHHWMSSIRLYCLFPFFLHPPLP